MGYAIFQFRDYGNYRRFVVGLNEDDNQLVLKQEFSLFITNELSPGIYTIKDISEFVYTKDNHERTLQIEYDDISMITKLNLTHFGLTFGTLRFNEKTFLIHY